MRAVSVAQVRAVSGQLSAKAKNSWITKFMKNTVTFGQLSHLALLWLTAER
jgi:hypothetical protein